MSNVPTASQTVGPFFSIGLSHLYAADAAPVTDSARHVTIRGRVLDGDGVGIPDATLEIWQSSGVANVEAANRFRRVATNERGEFAFDALKPVMDRDKGGATHAPHAVVLIFMRGLLRHLVTRIYFGGEASNADDAVLRLVPEKRRETLIATAASPDREEFAWDVCLQGERETVFFET